MTLEEFEQSLIDLGVNALLTNTYFASHFIQRVGAPGYEPRDWEKRVVQGFLLRFEEREINGE